jgi:hypothetical protein
MANKKIDNKGKIAIVVAILLIGTITYFLLRKKPKNNEEEVLKKAFDNLTFELNKSVIKPSSFNALDELATY